MYIVHEYCVGVKSKDPLFFSLLKNKTIIVFRSFRQTRGIGDSFGMSLW